LYGTTLRHAVENDGPPPSEMQPLEELMKVVDEAKNRPGDGMLGRGGGLGAGLGGDYYPEEDEDMVDGDGDGFSGDYGQYD
jgi:serine/threonine-protein kinase SRK2